MGAEKEMFGCTLAEFKASCRHTNFNDRYSVLMLAVGLQSDAQEIMCHNQEQARRFLNLSKALIVEVADKLPRLT
jgi:hypothetical protein